MPDAGARTIDLTQLASAEDLLGHYGGSLGLVPLPALSTRLAASGALAERLENVETGMQYGSIVRSVWAELALLTPAGIGQRAEVLDGDIGVHTDPDSGATVQNAGLYTAFGTGPGQWTWLQPTSLAGKADSADLAPVATSGDYDDLANLPTLGSAAAEDAADFATAAQGARADSAVQPAALAALAGTVDAKADQSEVEALQDALAGKADQGAVDSLQEDLATRAPANHTHGLSAVTGLQAALEGKAPAADLMATDARTIHAPDRPGDNPGAFSATLTGAGAEKAALSDTGVASISGSGLCYALTGAGVIASRNPVAIGRDVWEITARFRRTSNPADPNNHGIALRVAWLDAAKSQISLQTVVTKSDALTSSGLIQLSARLSALDVEGVIAPPTGAVYACPHLQTYGDDGTTAVETLRVAEITDLALAEIGDLSGLVAEVQAAIDAADAASLVATETLDTMADVATYSRPSNVTVISLKGGYAAHDGLGGQWAYDPSDTESPSNPPLTLVGADEARYKRVLVVPKTVYLDTVNGDDSSDGLLPASARATGAAAAALLQPGDTLRIARRSRLHCDQIARDVAAVKVEDYGAGPRPILDSSRPLPSSGWTQHGTHVKLWYRTVEHIADIRTQPSLGPDVTHFQMWEEWPLVDRNPLPAMLAGKFDGPDIASNLAWLAENPGSFTCHFVGSSAPDPRTDQAGQTQSVVYYVHTTDGSDPNDGETTLFYGEPFKWEFGPDWTVRNIDHQRGCQKDAVGSFGGVLFEHFDMRDVACHGIVGPHVARNCRAHQRAKPGLLEPMGGAFHQYRSDTTSVMRHGLAGEDIHAENFANAIFCHGSTDGLGQYDVLQYRNVHGKNCIKLLGLATSAVEVGSAALGVEVDGYRAENCDYLADAPNNTTLKNGVWISRQGEYDITGAVAAWGALTVENSLWVFRNAETSRRGLVGNMRAADEPGYLVPAHFRRCTTVRGQFLPGSLTANDVDYVFEDGVHGQVHEDDPNLDSALPTNVATRGTTYLFFNQSTVEEMQAQFANINDDTISPWVEQKRGITVGAGDLTWFDFTAIRSLTVSGTSGSTTITPSAGIEGFPFGDNFAVGQGIRILDYDGAGGTWETVIAAVDTSAETITVADAPDATFSGKTVHTAFFAETVWGEDSETTAVLGDQTELDTITLADATGVVVGTWLYIEGIGYRDDPGVYQVAAISGNDVTLDRDLAILIGWDGSRGPYYPHAAFKVRYGFPIAGGSIALSIDRAIGADLSTDDNGNQATADFNDSTISWTTGAMASASPDFRRAPIHYEEGYINVAIPASAGDVITWTATVFIADRVPRFVSDPSIYGRPDLVPGWIGTLGIGAAL